MVLWLAYLVPAVIATIVCYLTNPIVVLFADEEGELPSFLHYWQTWDDSCDSEFFMKECVPAWLDYDYDAHYIPLVGMDKWTARYGKSRQFSYAKNGAVWTIKQRIQRYVCRVLWLTRNCAYGFCFYLFGKDMSGAEYHKNEPNHFLCYSSDSPLLKPFCYKNETRITEHLYWKIYIGWKTYPNNSNLSNCMLAYRVLIKVVL